MRIRVGGRTETELEKDILNVIKALTDGCFVLGWIEAF
jgi:hypothetical protein